MTPLETLFDFAGMRCEYGEHGWAFSINWGKFCLGFGWWATPSESGGDHAD